MKSNQTSQQTATPHSFPLRSSSAQYNVRWYAFAISWPSVDDIWVFVHAEHTLAHAHTNISRASVLSLNQTRITCGEAQVTGGESSAATAASEKTTQTIASNHKVRWNFTDDRSNKMRNLSFFPLSPFSYLFCQRIKRRQSMQKMWRRKRDIRTRTTLVYVRNNFAAVM